MAVLTFPLQLAEFFDLLPIAKCRLDIPESLELAETTNGEIVAADFGTALWEGQIDLGVMLHEEAAAIGPLMNILRRGKTSIMVADATRPWPRFDPHGIMLTGSTPMILAQGGTAREISLEGLPAWYPISRGDLVSFAYGSSPTRFGLHEFVGSGAANASGQTALLEVSPPIRPGLLNGTAVQLVWPRCKAVLIPGTADNGQSSQTITSGATLRWRQTLR